MQGITANSIINVSFLLIEPKFKNCISTAPRVSGGSAMFESTPNLFNLTILYFFYPPYTNFSRGKCLTYTVTEGIMKYTTDILDTLKPCEGQVWDYP